MNASTPLSESAEVGGVDGGPYLAAWFGIYLWIETRLARI